MAIDVLANIAAAIPNVNPYEGVRAWNRAAPLLSKIKVNVKGGKAVYWTINNDGATAVLRGEGDDIQASEYNADDRLQATLNRGIYASSFGLTETELAVTASMRPEYAADLIVNQLAEQYNSHLAKLFNRMEQDCLVGTGTGTSAASASVNNIVGFQNALKTSGIYASLDVGTYTNLKANLQTGVGTLTAAMLDKAFSDILQASGTVPDFIMCSPATHSFVKKLTDTNVRFLSPELVRQVSGLARAPSDMGENVLSYNNVPIFPNSAWYQASANANNGDGYMLFGRFEDLELDVLPWLTNAGSAVTERSVEGQAGNGERVDRIPVPVKLYSPAKTGDSYKFTMVVEAQLKVKRPNAFAFITGITGS